MTRQKLAPLALAAAMAVVMIAAPSAISLKQHKKDKHRVMRRRLADLEVRGQLFLSRAWSSPPAPSKLSRRFWEPLYWTRLPSSTRARESRPTG